MQIGLFGKLPAKGDFLSRGIGPEVLTHWERWLEKVMGGAAELHGHNWPQVYGNASVWRFWIGEGVFGHAMAGVLAPSVDRVGRKFPLTILLTGAGARHPAPPLADEGSTQGWYDLLEQAVHYAQSAEFNGDIDGFLSQIGPPQGAAYPETTDRRAAFFAYGESGFERMLNDVGAHDHALAAAPRTYWWTAGNQVTGPAIIGQQGMLDAAGFGAMLAGFGPPVHQAVAAPVAPDPEPVEQWGDSPASDWDVPAEAEPAPEPAESYEDADSPFAAGGNWDVPEAAAWDVPAPEPEPEPEPQVEPEPEPETVTEASQEEEPAPETASDAETDDQIPEGEEDEEKKEDDEEESTASDTSEDIAEEDSAHETDESSEDATDLDAPAEAEVEDITEDEGSAEEDESALEQGDPDESTSEEEMDEDALVLGADDSPWPADAEADDSSPFGDEVKEDAPAKRRRLFGRLGRGRKDGA